MPASFTISIILSLVYSFHASLLVALSGPHFSSHVSKLSFSITIHVDFVPCIENLSSIDLTFPETLDKMLADIKPLGSAMICPFFTTSPTFTQTVAGAPKC